MTAMDPDRWWRGGVFYQIYPRSYADSNGDGVGDLPGIIGKLDHLARLGITGVWLSPVTCSPNRDWGYDVSDYLDIDPSFGTLADLDELVAQADRRGIRILMDLVPNHTSDQHAWFADALTGREARYRDYYVWADPKPDASLPNNWVSIFGGPAWELDEASGQYYLHNFEAGQPDLNWWNDEVWREFDEILRFWWDRGVSGFRIDVCNMMIKDKLLRDNPPATEDDPIDQQFMGVRYVYNSDRPEAHDILKHWRVVAGGYSPERLLIGETNVESVERLALFYGDGHDELHGGFNFNFMHAPFEASVLRDVVESTEALLPSGGWPVYMGSNHDFSRLATRWGGGEVDRTKLALLMLLTLRGTPFLYAGDEIGLVDGVVEKSQLLDPVGVRFWPYAGRDPERTPMPWHGGPGGGFSAPGVRPWLPMGDPAACNVADQSGDPASVLEFCRRVIAARAGSDDLAVGSYASLKTPSGTWGYVRGGGTSVLLNMSGDAAEFDGASGTVSVSTNLGLEGAPCEGVLSLGPWQGAVVVAPA